MLEEEYEEIEEIPEEGLCSYCYGEKLRLMQKSEYSAYDEYYAEMLDYVNESKLLILLSLSVLPTPSSRTLGVCKAAS